MPQQQVPLQDYIREQARAVGIPEELALSVAEQESSFNPEAMGPKLKDGTQAVGLFQLLPSRAKALGVNEKDPIQNIHGGVTYLRQLLDQHNGDLTGALNEYGGVKTSTLPYAQQVVGRMGKFRSPSQTTPAAAPTTAAPASKVATPPPTQKPYGERLTESLQRISEGQHRIPSIGEGLAAFNPLTAEGRRNWSGMGGAMAATALAPETLGTSFLIPMAGAMFGGGGEEMLEQTVGTRPPSWSAVGTASAQQGLQELVGQFIPWGSKLLARRTLTGTVREGATAAMTATREAETNRLADVLTTAQETARGVTRTTTRATRTATQAAKEQVRATRAEGAADIRETRATGTQAVEQAKTAATEGTTRATTEGETHVQRATDQATAARMAAERPFSEAVGTSPSAYLAGRQAATVIAGPAQEARDIAGKAVDAAAQNLGTVDFRPLKKAAQAVVDQVAPPERTFPRQTPEEIEAGIPPEAAAGFKSTYGYSLTQAAKDPTKAKLVADYLRQFPPAATSVLGQEQEQAARETLRHPVMKVVNRILNADDQGPGYDLHLWKSELQNALAGTYDKAVKKQVTSLTEHLTAEMRRALDDPAYNAATAHYASIVPLYTKEYAARFRRLAATDPESLVRMIKANKPTALRMLRDLLVGQSAAAGKAAEGQQAWDTVRGAWTHANILNKGIDGLEGQITRLPQEFADVFFGDAHGKEVLQNLRSISSAYRAASEAGNLGVAAAKASAESGVAEAKAAGRAGVETAEGHAAAALDQARQASAQRVEQARQTTGQTTEQVRLAGEDAQARAAQGVAGAKRSLQTYKRTPTPEEARFAQSTLAKKPMSGEEAAAHIARAAFVPGVWGWLSRMKLLFGGAAEKDLLEWVAYSSPRTQLFVRAATGDSYAGRLLADAVRASGLISTSADRRERKSQVGQPPPTRR